MTDSPAPLSVATAWTLTKEERDKIQDSLRIHSGLDDVARLYFRRYEATVTALESRVGELERDALGYAKLRLHLMHTLFVSGYADDPNYASRDPDRIGLECSCGELLLTEFRRPRPAAVPSVQGSERE